MCGFHCGTLVHHGVLARLLFGPMSDFLLATLLYRETRHESFSWQLIAKLLCLRTGIAVAAQHISASCLPGMWPSFDVRSSPLGTTASLYEPPPYPRKSSSADVHLYRDPVGRYSSLPHADHHPSLFCHQVCATPHHKLVQT